MAWVASRAPKFHCADRLRRAYRRSRDLSVVALLYPPLRPSRSLAETSARQSPPSVHSVAWAPAAARLNNKATASRRPAFSALQRGRPRLGTIRPRPPALL